LPGRVAHADSLYPIVALNNTLKQYCLAEILCQYRVILDTGHWFLAAGCLMLDAVKSEVSQKLNR
jgi:hypothetical protein